MKTNILLIIGMLIISGFFVACENEPIEYPDFKYQTVYFANQYPVRTVELGEDLFVDNSLDNEHKIEIKATTGGAYTNSNDITIDYVVDNALCDSLFFDDATGNDKPVTPMPTEYYSLLGDQITIKSGSILGGVQVQLTDGFFNDNNTLDKYYVIPLRLTNVQGADSILQGNPIQDNPDPCIASDWSIVPRDFVLYAVKYVNPWHGNYLRRGTDFITQLDGSQVTSERREEYVEDDEVISISTTSFNEVSLKAPVYATDGSVVIEADMQLTFDEDNNCTVTGGDGISHEITGTGEFVSKGEKNSIGGYDRNALYLEYKVEFNFFNLTYETKDTLVVRDRGIAPEYFKVVRK
jgi:hypothetical protein